MAHPFKDKAKSGVDRAKDRYAKGGAVHSDEAEDKKLFRKMMLKHEEDEIKSLKGKG